MQVVSPLFLFSRQELPRWNEHQAADPAAMIVPASVVEIVTHISCPAQRTGHGFGGWSAAKAGISEITGSCSVPAVLALTSGDTSCAETWDQAAGCQLPRTLNITALILSMRTAAA